MKIKLLIILIVSICFLTCNKNGKYKKSNTQKISPEKRETLKLLNEIKKRTKRDLEIMGIKKLLLNNHGEWFCEAIGATYFFYKSGILIQKYKSKKKKMYWKVENEKLYIKPNKTYYFIKASAAKDFGYIIGPEGNPNKYLRKIRYVLILNINKKKYERPEFIFNSILIKYFKKYNNY